jgi:hypothetical protein
MTGIPVEMVPEFPTDQRVVLLTEQAKYDPNLLSKMQAQLQKGGDVVITSNLLKAIPETIAQICELRIPGDALVNDFGRFGQAERDILVPQLLYQTNDAWEVISAGRPLTGGVSGYPILLRAQYSKGNLYVAAIPNDFGNLYDLPLGVLNELRRTVSKDVDIRIEAPAKVSLFLYDNGSFIVESFLDEPVTIQVLTKEDTEKLTDMVSGAVYEKLPPPPTPAGFAFYRFLNAEKNNTFRVTLPPHSYKVFTKK